MHKKCPYCKTDNNDFILLNQTADYSGIQMCLNRQGMFRVRYFDIDGDVFVSQDIINIKYCPMCGRNLTTQN